MYSFETRIRYSETDHTGTLSLPGLINYFQDCSTFQSEDIGLGVDILKQRNKAWILSYWQIVAKRYPKLGERVRIGTFATEFKGLYGHRNFVMYDEAGTMIACADSVWVFMDTEKGRPARPGDEDVRPYEVEEALEMEQEGRKIERPKECQDMPSFAVKKCHIDTNEHVNNGQYVQMAMEVVDNQPQFGKVRVEYRKSAVYGDIVYPRVAVEKERTVVELCEENGNPYAVVEFK